MKKRLRIAYPYSFEEALKNGLIDCPEPESIEALYPFTLNNLPQFNYLVLRQSDGMPMAKGQLKEGCNRMAATFTSLGVPCYVRHRIIGGGPGRSAVQQHEGETRAHALERAKIKDKAP